MRDVFEIIDGKPTEQDVEVLPQIPQTEDIIDLSSYVLMPQKCPITRKKIYSELETHIYAVGRNATGSMKQFKQYLEYALEKKVNFSKNGITIAGEYWLVRLNILDYALTEFVNNPKDMLEVLKYLIANVPYYQTKIDVDNRLYNLFGALRVKEEKVQELIKSANPEFIQAYKLLLQNGAKSSDAATKWINDKRWPIVFECPQILEIMLNEQDPEMIKYLECAFYTSEKSQQLYPIFKKYGFSFSEQKAAENLVKTYYSPENIKFLIENGELDPDKLKAVDTKTILEEKTSAETNEFFDTLNKITQPNPEKKYTTKKQLSAEEHIEQIFANANDCVESTN